jgi:hypothetical protein
MKGGDDVSSSIMKHLQIFLPDFYILWNNKEEQLLGKNYFNFSKFFVNFRGMLVRKPTP